MISINATLVLQVLHFLILVFVLNRILFRPILKVIDERTTYIETTTHEIKDLEVETELLRQKHVSLQNEARKNATLERTQIRGLGITEAEKTVSEVRQEISSIRATADKEAERQLEKTLPMLQGEAAKLADEIFEKVVGRRIAD
jgi:F-type H+-transporting ATPase subunit b